MAVRTLLEDTDVMLGEIPPLIPLDGKITAGQATQLSNHLRDIVTFANGKISHGTGIDGHKGNLDEQHVDVITPSTANVEFAVPHGLGRLPIAVTLVRKDRSVDIYDSSSGSWDDTVIYLKATVASAQVRLRLD